MSLLTRFFNLFRTISLERDLDDELRFYLAKIIERNVQKGMARAEAETEAHRELRSMNRTPLERPEDRVMRGRIAVVGLSLCVVTGVLLWQWHSGSRGRAD